MDSLLEIVISIVLYLVYFFFERFKGPKQKEEASAGDALQAEAAHARRMVAEAEHAVEALRAQPAWRERGVGHAWTLVLLPALRDHRRRAARALEQKNTDELYGLHFNRLKLSDLTTELSRLGRGLADDTLIGFTLVGGLEDLRGEALAAMGVPPDADVVASPDLDHRTVRHLVAAWSPILLGDILTARFDPSTGRDLIRQVRGLPEPHVSHQPGVPPPVVRGQVLAQALKERPPHPPTDELILAHSSGSRFAIPAAPVLDSTLEASRTLTQHRWGSLGSRTIGELTGAPLERVEAPEVAAPPPPPEPYATPAAIARRKAAEIRRQARRAAPAEVDTPALERPIERAPKMRRHVTVHQSVFSKGELGKAVVLSDVLPI